MDRHVFRLEYPCVLGLNSLAVFSTSGRAVCCWLRRITSGRHEGRSQVEPSFAKIRALALVAPRPAVSRCGMTAGTNGFAFFRKASRSQTARCPAREFLDGGRELCAHWRNIDQHNSDGLWRLWNRLVTNYSYKRPTKSGDKFAALAELKVSLLVEGNLRSIWPAYGLTV